MSERSGHESGVPCWVDHSSPDPAGAASFYGDLFGWDTEDQMPPGGPGQYFFANLRGRGVAAMGSQQSAQAPPTTSVPPSSRRAWACAQALRPIASAAR